MNKWVSRKSDSKNNETLVLQRFKPKDFEKNRSSINSHQIVAFTTPNSIICLWATQKTGKRLKSEVN